MKTMNIEIDGENFFVKAQKINGVTWVHHKSEILCYEPKKSRAGSSQVGVQDPTKVVSPMPGTILKINENSENIYPEGHTLIIMEAMKMEYSLKVTQEASIEKLNCKVGDQVSKDQVLAQLKIKVDIKTEEK